MFSKRAFSAFVTAAALVGVAHADVTPSEPGPGSSYQAGGTCTLSWIGDAESTTAWSDMSIQLMTGSNFDMVHLTTIATGQDGTVDGRFSYPCPEVVPYSAIYFYQFSAPGAPDKTWATRFTITSPTGETTPPSEPTQPGTNDPIPWGTGALADPSTAVPAPASAGGSPAAPAAGGAGANSTTPTPTPRVSTTTTTTTTPTRLATSAVSASSAAGANSTNSSMSSLSDDNSAAGALLSGSMMLGSVVAVMSSALAFAVGL